MEQKPRYRIQYTKVAAKFFEEHEDVKDRYREALKEWLIGEHPEKSAIKRIKGKRSSYYRMRPGNYRVIFAIIHGQIIVVNTVSAGSRGDVYKKMGNLK